MQGGPSLNSESGLLIISCSNCVGVSLFFSWASKKPSSVPAVPSKLNIYLVVVSLLKYGKLRKFPVSSSDFNLICFGKTSEPPYPKIALIDKSLFRSKIASTSTVVNKNT